MLTLYVKQEADKERDKEERARVEEGVGDAAGPRSTPRGLSARESSHHPERLYACPSKCSKRMYQRCASAFTQAELESALALGLLVSKIRAMHDRHQQSEKTLATGNSRGPIARILKIRAIARDQLLVQPCGAR